MFYIILTLYPLNKLKPDKMATVEEILSAMVDNLDTARGQVIALRVQRNEARALNDVLKAQLDETKAQVIALQAQLEQLSQGTSGGGWPLSFPKVPKAATEREIVVVAVALADADADALAAKEEEAKPDAVAKARGEILLDLFSTLASLPRPVVPGVLIANLTSLLDRMPSRGEIAEILNILMEGRDPTPFQGMFEELAKKSQIMVAESATMKATPEYAKAESEFVQIAMSMYRWIKGL